MMTIVFRIVFLGFAILYFIADHGSYNPNWIPLIYWPMLGFVYCLKCASIDEEIQSMLAEPAIVPNIEALRHSPIFKELVTKAKLSICCLFLFFAYYYKYLLIHSNGYLSMFCIPLFALVFVYNGILLKNNTITNGSKNIKAISEIISIIVFIIFVCMITGKFSFLFIDISSCSDFIENLGFNKFTILFFITLLLFEFTAMGFYQASEALSIKLLLLKEKMVRPKK